MAEPGFGGSVVELLGLTLVLVVDDWIALQQPKTLWVKLEMSLWTQSSQIERQKELGLVVLWVWRAGLEEDH